MRKRYRGARVRELGEFLYWLRVHRIVWRAGGTLAYKAYNKE